MGCSHASSSVETDDTDETESGEDAGMSGDGGCLGAVTLIESSVSEAIPTVGIVRWSTSLPNVEKASISFGQDMNYAFEAPVDLDAADNRTLLLGMKSMETYHFRVKVQNDEMHCVGGDRTIETGGLSTDLSRVDVAATSPSLAYGGFTVTSDYAKSKGIILDADGEYVWWFDAPFAGVNRARMSADGKHMLIGNVNVRNNGEGAIFKVSMDGLDTDIISLPDRHHDFTVLPDGDIAIIEYDRDGAGTCDRIVEITEDGARETIYAIRNDFEYLATNSEWCHANALSYDPRENVYYLSVLAFDAILKIDRSSGALVWVLGGEVSSFEGTFWDRQHGHHALSNGNMLLFNNHGDPEDFTAASKVLEYALDGDTARLVWQYDGDATSTTFGDVQRLGNGNTLVTYSNAGLIHEVDTDTGTPVIIISFGASIGYADRRDTLYGLPQRYR